MLPFYTYSVKISKEEIDEKNILKLFGEEIGLS
jgi:hypothetical protein